MATSSTIDMKRGVYRRIYSGFVKGRRICSVSMAAQGWFWRIHALADDFGNLEADPLLLHAEARGRCLDVTPEMSEAWISELAAARLLTIYEVGGDRYIHCEDFDKLQPAGKNGRKVERVPSRADARAYRAARDIPVNPGESGRSGPSHDQAQTIPRTSPKPSPKPTRAEAGGGDSSLRGGQADPAAAKGAFDALTAEPWPEIRVRKARELCASHNPDVIHHAIRMAKRRKAGGGLVVTLLEAGEAAEDLELFRDRATVKRAKTLWGRQPKREQERLIGEYGVVLGDPLEDEAFVAYLVDLMRQADEAVANNGAGARAGGA